MVNTKKRTVSKRRWTEADDDFLIQMVGRHVPRAQMAKVMDRTEKAIIDRLHRTHREAWLESDHPESQPRISTSAATPAIDLSVMEAKIDTLIDTVGRVDQKLAKLLSELHGQPQDEAQR